MAEIPFESLQFANETTRGTGIANPTHRLNMVGTILPQQEVYRPDDNLGVLAAASRSEIVKRWATISADGAMDVDTLPILCTQVLDGSVSSPSTPGGATNTRRWTFVRKMDADNIKSATWWWGDTDWLTAKMFKGVWGMVDELTLESDTAGSDGSMQSIAATCQFPDDAAEPTLVSAAVGALIVPKKMQLWLDTSAAIGTTAITGRVISASHTIPTGVTYKYPATGPTGGVTYSNTGRIKTSPTTKIRMELLDVAQWDIFQAGTLVKLRVKHNGPNIESTFYYSVQVDMYGILDAPDWGELEGSNRTIEFTVIGEKHADINSDCQVIIDNIKTTL